MLQLLKNIWTIARINSPISFNSDIHKLKIENLILRQQLSTLINNNKNKPKLSSTDRAFWFFVSQKVTNWKELLVIVRPETVIRWHKKGFKLFWKLKSKGGGGRPKINKEVRDLIIKMANENNWGAPRIHGELTSKAAKELAFWQMRCVLILGNDAIVCDRLPQAEALSLKNRRLFFRLSY